MFERFRLWRAQRHIQNRRDWKLHAHGGGAAIDLRGFTKQRAIDHCAERHGIVTFTDESTGFIFYKPFGWKAP